jgi:hypothetical protein
MSSYSALAIFASDVFAVKSVIPSAPIRYKALLATSNDESATLGIVVWGPKPPSL